MAIEVYFDGGEKVMADKTEHEITVDRNEGRGTKDPMTINQ